MEVLDKLFKKYSYKFDKGYPDINNEQDILLLENILNGLNIKVNLKETNLARRHGTDVVLRIRTRKKL